MLLFKPEHINPILAGTKTQTRRVWKRCRVKPGTIYGARTSYNAVPFALLRVRRVWQERLLDITDDDARAEGYVSREAFLEVFRRINRLPEIPSDLTVWAIEFEVVNYP